jgi:DNA-binding transcriptional regulator YhcF (GntR family)
MAAEPPPYQRIVTDLRHRISAGELAPGDRVPSTRQIAKDWGVALATATKALTVLRQQGVVQARPRVGTVVTAPPERPPVRAVRSSPETELTRERIVQAAIAIADAEGLDALSMRGVAARLGVATMSTYRYVTNKDELVVLMADAAFGELGYAEPHPVGWRPILERTARTMWALHRRHPWLAQLSSITRPLPLPNLLVHGEQLLHALDDLDFDAIARLDLQILLYSYIQGLAVHLEREAQAQATTGLSEDEWVEQRGPELDAMAASGRYPGFAALLTAFADTGYDLDLDKIFELGLRTLLDGLAPLFAHHRKPA